MSELDTEKQVTVNRPFKTFKVFSNTIFGFIIRAAQFFVTILVLGLSGDSLNRYVTSGSMSYTLFSAVFTLIYLIIFTVLTFLTPSVLIIGVNLILELLITIFWFTAFISIAAIYGPDDCDYTFSSGWFYYSINKNACQASKAAIAFAAVNFALFLVSLVSLFLTSFKNLSTDQLFQTNSVNGATLNKPLIAVTSVGGTGATFFATDEVAAQPNDELVTNVPTEQTEETEPKTVEEVDQHSAATPVTPN